jgi:hypothetical protein|tara:strand:- start:149 stop:814 length:666 start_codon:yes stop_codon:yes gene_type:complete
MPGMNPVKPIVLFLFLIFSAVLFAGTGLAKSESGAGTSQKWAVVSGFRSAQFGMNERDILKAIRNDFGLEKKQVSRQVHPNEKTISLEIKVSKLLPESDPAKIFYILGYKTRRLIHINVIWGRPVMKDPNAEAVVATANQLRNHFVQKKYRKEGFALNAQLGEGLILVFQGKDRKGRAARLLLSNPKSEGDKKAGENIALTLSYIERPEDPDVYRIKEGDF